MQIFIILSLVACAFGATREFRRPMPDGRIVGGEDADISNYPYQLSLQLYGSHICGASIVSANWAVTAAHCIIGKPPTLMSLRAGTSVRGSGGAVHQVSFIRVHSGYDDLSYDYDVAVIEVSSPFEFDQNVKLIGLDDGLVIDGTSAVTTGWGAFLEGGELSLRLQKITVPVLPHVRCNNLYEGRITKRMMCAGYEAGGRDTCQGDSGGPLAYRGLLIGIVSWGHGCARPNYPGIYTRVSSVSQWIASNSGSY